MKVVLMLAAILASSLSYGQLIDYEPITLDLQDHKIQFASDAINKHLQAQDSNTLPQHAIQVISATKAVISGWIYHLKIKMEAENELRMMCNVKLWEHVWMKPSLKSLNVSCKPELLMGGPKAADFNDAKVEQALSFLTDHFNQEGNYQNRAIPQGGLVTRQMVLGDVYRFYNVHMFESTCKNSKETQGKFTAEQCPIKDGVEAHVGRLNAKVYWDLKKFSVLDIDVMDTENFIS